MSSGVFVLGTGRCGTSAASRLINLLGLPLSAPGDVIDSATETNLTGSWESRALAAINEELMWDLGGSAIAPPVLHPGWHDDLALDAIRERAREEFGRVYPSDRWVWKDPRNCTTLPFWIDITSQPAVCVVVTRDLEDVYRSLRKATGRTDRFSLAIWERRTRDLLTNIAGLPVFFTTFESLLADPVSWSTAVSDVLGRVSVGAEPVQTQAIRAFIDPAIATSNKTGPSDLISAEQRELFAVVSGFAGFHGRFAVPDLPPETPWTDIVLAEHRSDYIRELEAAKRWLDGQWRHWQQEAERLKGRVADLERGTFFAAAKRLTRRRGRQR